jgi:hypothetical protein
VLAYAAGRAMEALLAGVRPADGVTFATAVALATIMTVAGTLMPTLRALRVDPIMAIRTEEFRLQTSDFRLQTSDFVSYASYSA